MNNQNTNRNACAQWDDRCMMTDLLDTAKHITEVYGAYVCEGSSETLRQVLQDNMDATANDQFQIFQQMQQRGWYQTKAAQQQDVQQAKQKFAQQTQQLM